MDLLVSKEKFSRNTFEISLFDPNSLQKSKKQTKKKNKRKIKT